MIHPVRLALMNYAQKKTDKIPDELGYLEVASMLWKDYGIPADLTMTDVFYAIELHAAKARRDGGVK